MLAAAGFGVAELLAAVAPSYWLQVAALVPLGAASVTFAAGVNSSLQLGAEPAMRGRVMALYAVVFLGSTPIGAPLVGWLAEVAGPRSGLLAGGAAALAAAAWARWALRALARAGRRGERRRSGKATGATAARGAPRRTRTARPRTADRAHPRPGS